MADPAPEPAPVPDHLADLRAKAEQLAACGDVMSRELLAAWAARDALSAEKFGWETTCQQLRDAIKELKKENARLDASETQLIGERDRAEAVADSLAYAVGGIDLIGEHTSQNCPWENALELVTPHAEVERLRGELAAMQAAATEAISAEPLENSLSQRPVHCSMTAGDVNVRCECYSCARLRSHEAKQRLAALLAPPTPTRLANAHTSRPGSAPGTSEEF